MARNWSLPENWYPLFLGMYPLFVASQLAANDHAKLGSVNLLSFDSQWSEAGRDQQPSCFSPEIKGLFVEIYNFTQFYLFGAWTVGTPHLRKKRASRSAVANRSRRPLKRCVLLLTGPPQPCCQDTHWHFGCRFSMKIPGTMDKCLLALLFFGQNGRQLAAHLQDQRLQASFPVPTMSFWGDQIFICRYKNWIS